MRFSKTGAMSMLSHLELITLFTRAAVRGNVPVAFSQGFHPHPKFSFATATQLGIESYAEYMDMFVEAGISASEVRDRLNRALPEGLRIMEATTVPRNAASLSTLISGSCYRISFNEIESKGLAEKCVRFLAHNSFIINRAKKSGVQDIDLRSELSSLSASGNCIEIVAGRGKPIEFARAITGNSALSPGDIQVQKLNVIFSGE